MQNTPTTIIFFILISLCPTLSGMTYKDAKRALTNIVFADAEASVRRMNATEKAATEILSLIGTLEQSIKYASEETSLHLFQEAHTKLLTIPINAVELQEPQKAIAQYFYEKTHQLSDSMLEDLEFLGGDKELYSIGEETPSSTESTEASQSIPNFSAEPATCRRVKPLRKAACYLASPAEIRIKESLATKNSDVTKKLKAISRDTTDELRRAFAQSILNIYKKILARETPKTEKTLIEKQFLNCIKDSSIDADMKIYILKLLQNIFYTETE